MKYTKVLGSIALSALLVMGMSGCGSSSSSSSSAVDDSIPFGDGEFSPFERVAVFPTVKVGDTNDTDHIATYAKVSALAALIGKYVANKNETLEDNTTFTGTPWILGGLDGNKITGINDFNTSEVLEHTLNIPTKLPIDPTQAVSPSNTKKVRVVEVCNSGYASQALGVVNVGGVDGAKVQNGGYHATALPCEITVYNDENGIYVDMLNPETIFTLFFTEVFSSDEMENENFKNAMFELPTQVKKEIFAMIYNAFDEDVDTNGTYTKTSTKMGPLYTTMSDVIATTDTANGGKEPFLHYTYTAADANKEFTKIDAKAIATTIMKVMTIDGDSNAGKQEADLKTILPSTIAGINPAWRSGRDEPLAVPNGSMIIEACSPTYAKEALSTGEYHTPALPCEIAVTVNPDNNNTIDISILNPEFMFGALFADAMEDMSSTQIDEFNAIIDNINGDLKTIVDYSVEHNITDLVLEGEKITPILY